MISPVSKILLKMHQIIRTGSQSKDTVCDTSSRYPSSQLHPLNPDCPLEPPEPVQAGFVFEVRTPNLLVNHIRRRNNEMKVTLQNISVWMFQFENHSNMALKGLHIFLEVGASCHIIDGPLKWSIAHMPWLYWNSAQVPGVGVFKDSNLTPGKAGIINQKLCTVLSIGKIVCQNRHLLYSDTWYLI